MSDIAIRVENLGKQYKTCPEHRRGGGRLQKRNDTLRDSISELGLRIAELGKRGNGAHPTSDFRNPTSDFIWALRDVSFEVKRGKVVGIIGRNGAGKSTRR